MTMQEHARMMAAWQAAGAAGGACVLATVVATRGSSYRSPGARMLVLPDGSRIGAVSGGCLEGELCRRAHWWTAQTPAVLRRFDTSNQEDNEGFGLGCGGSIELLLERLEGSGASTHPLLAQELVQRARVARAVAVAIETPEASGLRVGARFDSESAPAGWREGFERAVELGISFTAEVDGGARVFFESLLPPIQLLICGAGNDAQPLAAQAAALGWPAVVLDQRADLAQAARFPSAARVLVARDAAVLQGVQLDARTAAIVMSHSFAQDSFFLRALVDAPLAYVGVLGSRRRTLDLLAGLGRETAPAQLYAPAGLDIGAETPEQIALSILGEVQACFAGRRGGALRKRAGSIHGREMIAAPSYAADVYPGCDRL
jgi:xanthine dehydrogenase accessory factor